MSRVTGADPNSGALSAWVNLVFTFKIRNRVTRSSIRRNLSPKGRIKREQQRLAA
jgi:hypothetical protein